MARPLKVPKDIHLASGASDKSQLAATGMQLKMIVQLHITVKATRKTGTMSEPRSPPQIFRLTYQASQKHSLRFCLHESSQIEGNRYLDEGDSIHVDQAMYEHQKQELFCLIAVYVIDMPPDTSFSLLYPQSKHC